MNAMGSGAWLEMPVTLLAGPESGSPMPVLRMQVGRPCTLQRETIPSSVHQHVVLIENSMLSSEN